MASLMHHMESRRPNLKECDEYMELLHFVASLMHHMESRRPNLKECDEYMEKTYGFEHTKELLYENPRKLIENKLIEEL